VGEAAMGYLFIAPLLLVFGAFVLYPLGQAILYALSRYQFLTGVPPRFTGLENVQRWVTDERVLESIGTTLQYTLIYVPVSTLFALAVAMLLDRVVTRRLATIYRVLLYLPVVLPASIVFHMWKWMYDPTWGLFNQLLGALGIPGLRWLSDPDMALPSIAMMEVWHLTGITMMLFLVGLNNIPRELGEAATVDGASPWQVARHINLPLLRPMLLIVLVLRLQSLGVIVPPLIMTDGGPIRATTTYGLQAYFIAFRDTVWNIGYASTWFVILGLFSALLAFTGWRAMRAQVE
jgi:ABC-type sugar transport system permease subunit